MVIVLDVSLAKSGCTQYALVVGSCTEGRRILCLGVRLVPSNCTLTRGEESKIRSPDTRFCSLEVLSPQTVTQTESVSSRKMKDCTNFASPECLSENCITGAFFTNTPNIWGFLVNCRSTDRLKDEPLSIG